MESFLSGVEELGAAPARQPARSSPAPARSFVNCRRFKISLLSLVFGNDPVQNIGMDVPAETEETVLTGTEDAAPVQADNKTVKAVDTAKITLRIKSPRKNQGNEKAGTETSRLSLQQRRRNMEHFFNDGSL